MKILLTTLFVLSVSHAFAQSERVLLEKQEGHMVEAKVFASVETLRKAPKWNGHGTPPLTQEEVIKLAWGAIDNSEKKYQLYTLTLKKFENEEFPDTYFYLAEFHATKPVTDIAVPSSAIGSRQNLFGGAGPVIILMDKTVLKPEQKTP